MFSCLDFWLIELLPREEIKLSSLFINIPNKFPLDCPKLVSDKTGQDLSYFGRGINTYQSKVSRFLAKDLQFMMDAL